MKHKHYETIMAWANGAEIEMKDKLTGEWREVISPSWYNLLEYRVRPEPKPNIVHETLITLSRDAGAFMYAASPLEANILLVFDG